MLEKTMSDYSLEMVRWLGANPNILHLIASNGDDSIRPKYALDVVERIGQSGYYGLIYLFMYRFRNSDCIDEVGREFLLDKVGDVWERDGAEKILKDLTQKLRIKAGVSDMLGR